MVLEILDIHRHCWPSQQGRKEGIHEYERCTWRITAWLLYGCHYQFSTELCRACVDVRNASLGRSEAHIAQNGKIGRAQRLPPNISSLPIIHLLGEHGLCTSYCFRSRIIGAVVLQIFLLLQCGRSLVSHQAVLVL